MDDINNSFEKDLNRGKEIELKVLSIIQKTCPSATLINAYKGYDIWIPETHKSIEVKYDPMSNVTGNLVVEIEMFNKPSGLMITTADKWIFYDDKIFLMIKPMDIVNCIFLNKLIHTQFVGKGDTEPKKAFLVSKQLLVSFGKILDA